MKTHRYKITELGWMGLLLLTAAPILLIILLYQARADAFIANDFSTLATYVILGTAAVAGAIMVFLGREIISVDDDQYQGPGTGAV